MNPRKSVSLSIKLEILKGSVNAMLIPTKYGRRLIYGAGYRAAKANVKKVLDKEYKSLEGSLAKDCPEFYFTRVRYIVKDKWLTKSSKYRKLRKKDVSNFTKNSEDVIFTFLGVDDSSIIESNVRKGLIEGDETPSLHVTIDLYDMDVSALKG